MAWEAQKAVVRGFVIQYASHKKKKSVMKQTEIENKIKKLETDLKRCFNANGFRELPKLKYEHNCILSQKVEFSLFRMRQKYFESGDKMEKLLANGLRQRELFSLIPSIRAPGGDLLTKSIDVNNAFKDFYKELYTSNSSNDEENMKGFLKT